MEKSRRDLIIGRNLLQIIWGRGGEGSTEIMDLHQIKFLARASAQLTNTATNLALIYLSQ
jgi:hypothetical protein